MDELTSNQTSVIFPTLFLAKSFWYCLNKFLLICISWFTNEIINFKIINKDKQRIYKLKWGDTFIELIELMVVNSQHNHTTPLSTALCHTTIHNTISYLSFTPLFPSWCTGTFFYMINNFFWFFYWCNRVELPFLNKVIYLSMLIVYFTSLFLCRSRYGHQTTQDADVEWRWWTGLLPRLR